MSYKSISAVIKSVLCCACLIIFSSAQAQDVNENFKKMETAMLQTVDSMYDSPLPEWRHAHAQKLIRQLVETLKGENSFHYGFDSLAKVVNIIYSPDKSFRIINWSITQSGVTQRYFGAIQVNSKNLKLYPLIDISQDVTKGLDDSVFKGPRWFGGIIYNILHREVEGKNVYFLFTKNDGAPLSTFKIIEPMVFTANEVVFGLPAFAVSSQSTPGKRANRFVLEYKKDVQAGLNWSEDLKAIVFDRLASVASDPNRKYTFAPTGQYDALRWENNSWNYVQDVLPFTELVDGQEPVGGVDMPK